MSITITRPLMTLLDGNGLPVPGVTKSRSSVEAMEKASQLPDGVYYLQRPDATIEVSGNVVQAIPMYTITHIDEIVLGE